MSRGVLAPSDGCRSQKAGITRIRRSRATRRRRPMLSTRPRAGRSI